MKTLQLKKGELVAIKVISDEKRIAELDKWKTFKVSHVSDNNYLFSVSGQGQRNLVFFHKDQITPGFFQVLHMQFEIKPLKEFTFWNRIGLQLFS